MSDITPTERRPNVVLINCDDLGWGDLGCYGSEVNSTPTVDRLAAEGLKLDAFYMGSPVCSPSRGALLTGCYPPRIGFGSFDGMPVLFPGQPCGLDPEEISLARLLRDAGYRTQMVGKWHCGDQDEFLPTNHGFDHYFGLPYSNDMGRQVVDDRVRAMIGDTDPDLIWPPLPLMDDADVLEEQPDQASLTARYVNEAVRFMRDARDDPFFLYVAHLYVHIPIYVLDGFADRSRNGRYGAAVESIDWATAVILDELDRLGLASDTIVVFTSDNGSRVQGEGGSNGPFRGTKATTWEGGLRVPCIVRWPDRIAAGRVSDELTTAMDLYPTLAGLCDAELPSDRTIDGRDLGPLWLDDEATSPHEAFFYYWMDDLEAVRDGRWKLHFAKHGEPVSELYDLLDDPGETRDVIDDHPEVVARLESLAEGARSSLGDSLRGRIGSEVRPIGRVTNARPLTSFDPDHPYCVAEYDLADRG